MVRFGYDESIGGLRSQRAISELNDVLNNLSDYPTQKVLIIQFINHLNSLIDSDIKLESIVIENSNLPYFNPSEFHRSVMLNLSYQGGTYVVGNFNFDNIHISRSDGEEISGEAYNEIVNYILELREKNLLASEISELVQEVYRIYEIGGSITDDNEFTLH